MPKVHGLTAQEWYLKAKRAEEKYLDTEKRLQFANSVIAECKRKINQLRREKRELLK